MRIANRRDDLWVEVKCQANSEIAGSPRNAFRCSPPVGRRGGIALDRRGGFPLTDPNQTTNAADSGRACLTTRAGGVRRRVRRFVVERETAQTAG